MGKIEKLTKKQTDILNLLLTDNLSLKEISNRRKISIQAVYRIVKRIEQKGYTELKKFNTFENVKKFKAYQPSVVNSDIGIKQNWAYHALHFVIRPYFFFDRYHVTRREVGNQSIKMGDWELFLNSETVELMLQKGARFSNADKWASIEEARRSFQDTLNSAGDKYGFAIWKEGKANVRLVRQHLARNPSDIAQANKENYLAVKGIDGKIWFMIDKSKGAEHEYTHGEDAVQDSEKIEPYFNDLKQKAPPMNSQLAEFIAQVIQTNLVTQNQLSALTILQKNMVTQWAMDKGMRFDEQGNIIKAEEPPASERPDYIN